MSRLLQCFRENSHFSGGLSIRTADQFVFFTFSILICHVLHHQLHHLFFFVPSFPKFNVSYSEQWCISLFFFSSQESLGVCKLTPWENLELYWVMHRMKVESCVFTLLKFPKNWFIHNSAIQENADKPRFKTCRRWECIFAQFHGCPLYSQKQTCAIYANKMAGRDGSVQLLVFLRLSPPSKGETVNSTSPNLDIGQLHLRDLNSSNQSCFATVLDEFL